MHGVHRGSLAGAATTRRGSANFVDPRSANGLRTAQKSRRIAEAAVLEFVDLLGAMPIETVALPSWTALVEVRLLALAQDLSAYDAAYLALAQRLDLPLATLDGTGRRMGLKQAAAATGVRLVDERQIAAWLGATP